MRCACCATCARTSASCCRRSTSGATPSTATATTATTIRSTATTTRTEARRRRRPLPPNREDDDSGAVEARETGCNNAGYFGAPTVAFRRVICDVERYDGPVSPLAFTFPVSERQLGGDSN